MSKTKRTISKIKSRIDVVKKANDNPAEFTKKIQEQYLKDLPSQNVNLGKKLSAYADKRARKKDNKTSIFDQIIEIAESFVGTDKSNKNFKAPDINGINDALSRERLKLYAIDSAGITIKSFKNIVSDNVKKTFFAGDGVCGANATFPFDSIDLSPKEFDFREILTISPDTNVGKIIYERATPDINKQKLNRELYKSFTGVTYQFNSNNSKTLFTSTWNTGTQKFQISGLTQGGSVTINDFFTDYYSSIELPDLSNIVNNSMLGILQGDGSETEEFAKAQQFLNRLTDKIFSICGNRFKNNLGNQDAINQFQENDEDIEYYFDFDDVEGIDLDDEDARLRKVMRFVDCNNFEVPINTDIVEDFVYLTDKKTSNDLTEIVFNRLATDAYNQSDKTIPLLNFKLSAILDFIKNLPKVLVSSLITPAVFLPIVIVYKLFKTLPGVFLAAKDMLIRVKKLVVSIIKDIFWKFLSEFWKKIKRDLLRFLQNLSLRILKEKYKRYVAIVTVLIALLRQILESGIDNCEDLFNIILNTINTALRGVGGIGVPAFLLGFSDLLPGMSETRMAIDITEKLSSSGVPTDNLSDGRNNLVTAINSITAGLVESMDRDSFVKGTNKEMIVPSPVGPIIIPPGILQVVGKQF